MYFIVTKGKCSGKCVEKVGKHNLMNGMQTMIMTDSFKINNNY